MATSLDELLKKLEGFESMMQETLDKVSSIEAWRSLVDESTATLLTKTEEAAAHPHCLESIPPLPPRQFPPPPLPVWVNPFDLNLVPPQASRPHATTLEWPSGHHLNRAPRMLAAGS